MDTMRTLTRWFAYLIYANAVAAGMLIAMVFILAGIDAVIGQGAAYWAAAYLGGLSWFVGLVGTFVVLEVRYRGRARAHAETHTHTHALTQSR